MTVAEMTRCDGCGKCDEHGAFAEITLRLGTDDRGLHFCDWMCVEDWARNKQEVDA